ncbi:thiopurine S-methyltransferase [Ixodes scapularis]|uniref:thiopurine S-methyltransferase n=1 Tax=Ixodes scapularis TaxID=6945 RepID=UPI001C3950AB|nr:thiopurine S-methyltransferase [Ixodes scapularis]
MSDESTEQHWAHLWSTGDTNWHNPDGDPFLKKHQDVILAGKEDAQVFVPLCGKAVELKWFYDKGHRVVGVEVVEAPVREFFDENALPCEESFCPVLNRKILQTPDKRLRIFICNIFDFNTSCAGPMDIVWDKGGLIAVGDADAPRYVSILKSLLAPDFSYGLWVIDYEAEGYAGTPRPMPEGRIRNLFGDGMKLTLVDKSEPKVGRFLPRLSTRCLWHLTGRP